MNLHRINLEQALYFLAVTIAVVIRFVSLRIVPLNDAEAALALQSLDLLRGGVVTLAPHPFYLLGTSLLFFVFGASEFSARFLPAAAGVLMVGLPYFFRRQLGRRTALILTFLIAFDPGLIGSSNQSGSLMIGLTCMMFALASWTHGKSIRAGIFAGLTLLGGPAVWPGAAALVIAAFSSYSRDKSGLAEQAAFEWRKAGLAALASLALGGTLFMFIPSGINAAASSLPAYFTGWGQAGTTSIPLMVGALLAYEVLALVLAIPEMVRGLRREGSALDRFLTFWLAAALVLVLVYPARQVVDLIWVVVPLLALAARHLDRMLRLSPSERGATLGQAALVLILLVLLVNLVISWPQAQTSSANVIYRWTVLVLALVLLVAESFLVGWGWSARIASSGLLWGVTGLLAIYTLAAGFGVAGYSGRSTAELWRNGPVFTGQNLLRATILDYIQWSPELGKTSQVVVSGLTSPAVRWALRDLPGLKMETILAPASQPDFVITSDQVDLSQAAAYSGQDFDLSSAPAWDLITPIEWINWLVYRKVQPDAWQTTRLILWVRADRFPGAAGLSTQP